MRRNSNKVVSNTHIEVESQVRMHALCLYKVFIYWAPGFVMMLHVYSNLS